MYRAPLRRPGGVPVGWRSSARGDGVVTPGTSLDKPSGPVTHLARALDWAVPSHRDDRRHPARGDRDDGHLRDARRVLPDVRRSQMAMAGAPGPSRPPRSAYAAARRGRTGIAFV